jgi:hypothetical protein
MKAVFSFICIMFMYTGVFHKVCNGDGLQREFWDVTASGLDVPNFTA